MQRSECEAWPGNCDKYRGCRRAFVGAFGRPGKVPQSCCSTHRLKTGHRDVANYRTGRRGKGRGKRHTYSGKGVNLSSWWDVADFPSLFVDGELASDTRAVGNGVTRPLDSGTLVSPPSSQLASLPACSTLLSVKVINTALIYIREDVRRPPPLLLWIYILSHKLQLLRAFNIHNGHRKTIPPHAAPLLHQHGHGPLTCRSPQPTRTLHLHDLDDLLLPQWRAADPAQHRPVGDPTRVHPQPPRAKGHETRLRRGRVRRLHRRGAAGGLAGAGRVPGDQCVSRTHSFRYVVFLLCPATARLQPS